MHQQISERALVARINRVLAKDNEVLRTCRYDSRSFSTLGRYYIIDLYRNVVDTYGIDDLNDIAEQSGIAARLTA